jgi:hypothetical protein
MHRALVGSPEGWTGRTILPSVILSVAKDLKKLVRDAVE